MKSAVPAESVMPERRIGMPKKREKANIQPFTFSGILYIAAVTTVLFIVICAAVPQWIALQDPTEMKADAILQPPGKTHWFGTDYFGRDVFSLVVYGCRESLLIGVASVLFGGIVGALIGSLSGYVGGWIDVILMRLIDVLMTIPGLLLSLAIAAALGPSLFNIVLAISISSIPGYARVMRGQVLTVAQRPFVAASRSLGANHAHIFLRHVLPNCVSPLLVMGTIGVGSAILSGSALSFLGLGVLKEIPDWGTLLSQGRGYVTVAWWITAFPGLAITVLVLSVNLIGDRLRDWLDPKRSR